MTAGTETRPAGTEQAAGRFALSGPGRAGTALLRRMGPATVAFALLAGIFGLLFAVMSPPFWGHDELTQFGRAYQVAHGGLTPARIEDDRGVSYGGEVPAAVEALMGYALDDYTHNPGEPYPDVADPGAYQRLSDAPVTDERKIIWFTNTAAYSAVPYVPNAIGIRFAELIDADAGTMVRLTRLSGLAAYLLVVGFALWALRAHRIQWLAFTAAVLPIAVFQSGTITADTLTNALAVLVSALLVKGLFLGDRLGRTETAAVLASAILLPLCKPTYVLLAMLVVLIPAERMGLTGWRRWLTWICAAIGAIGFAVWMKIAAPTGEGTSLMRPRNQWYTVDTGEQLTGIITDPFGFLRTFWESILRRDQEWFTEFFGELGFAYIDVPATAVVACLLAFAVSVGITERLDKPDFRRTVVVALTMAASVAMIYVTLYMSFTPVGYYIIDGVQGRYFIPLAIVSFAVLLRWMPFRLRGPGDRPPGRLAEVTIVAAALVSLLTSVAKYHLYVWA
ncbi:DUF2142 domain-containing protein [Nocardia sp. NBC_00416]|uniref:DUF2142 domain-containing protein n=1 Tax=Nocardia sp. NBC_00416 TaxID=2975991 RepID=UPI002E24E73F